MTELKFKPHEQLTDEEFKQVFMDLNLFKEQEWTETEKYVDRKVTSDFREFNRTHPDNGLVKVCKSKVSLNESSLPKEKSQRKIFLVKAEPTEMEDKDGNIDIGFCSEDIEEVIQLDSVEEKITKEIAYEKQDEANGWGVAFHIAKATIQKLKDEVRI